VKNQSRMVSVLSFDVDSKVDDNNAGGKTGCGFVIITAEEILTEMPEISNGFSDYTEEFDFKQRTRWRRPSFIMDLLEDTILSTDMIVAVVMVENGVLESSLYLLELSSFYKNRRSSDAVVTQDFFRRSRQGRDPSRILHHFMQVGHVGSRNEHKAIDTFLYQPSTALSVNISGSIDVGLITDQCGEHGCFSKWGDHEDFMSSRHVTLADTDQLVVLSLYGISSMLSFGILHLTAHASGFHPSVTSFGTSTTAVSSHDANKSATKLCLQYHDMNDLLVTMSQNTYVQLMRTCPIRKLHVLDFGETRHFAHHMHLSLVLKLLTSDTDVMHAMNRGVIVFYLGGLIRSHRLWCIAQQFGFIHQLVVAWGGILPSTIALLKPTRYYKMNGEHSPMMMQDFINSEVLWYWKKNGEQYLHELDKTRRLYYHRLGHNYLSAGEYHHGSQDLHLSFCGSQGFATQFYSCSRHDTAVRFFLIVICMTHHLMFRHSITVTCMQHHPLFEDIIQADTIILEHGEILLHRVDQVIRPWGDYSSCESYTLLCRIDDYASVMYHDFNVHRDFSFKLWKTSTSIRRLDHVLLFWKGNSCVSCIPCASNDAVLLAEDINLVLFCGEFLMHEQTSTSMSPVDLCFADHATSLIISNAACAIYITASVVSWVIGEWLAEKTKHNVRCFYQDTLIIGTGLQDIIPSHSSSPMDIHPHDLAVITSAILGSTQLRRIFLPWGATPSKCALIILLCRIDGYIFLARKHQSSDSYLYKFLVVRITHSIVKSSVIDYLLRIQDFTFVDNNFSATHDITNYFLDTAQVMTTSEDGENIYCVSSTSLDLTLIASVNYFGTGSSSAALARVDYGAVLRNTATSTIGYVRTIGIASHCALRSYGEPTTYHLGEPTIYRLRDCEQVCDVKSDYELCCPASDELYHICMSHVLGDIRDVQETVPVNFTSCQHINAGCSLQSSITSSRCNYSTALVVEHFVGNTVQDIVSVQSSDGHEQLQLCSQLQVQVTNAQLQQVQVTSEIPFSNEHITSSFASSDMQPTSTNLATHHHCNRVHPEANNTIYERDNLREHTTYFNPYDSKHENCIIIKEGEDVNNNEETRHLYHVDFIIEHRDTTIHFERRDSIQTNYTITEGEVDGITEGTSPQRLFRENVRTDYEEKSFHMLPTLAGWGVSPRDEFEVCGIENASAFAPYLGMIIFKIWRIGVSIRHHFTRNHQTTMKMKCCTQLTIIILNVLKLLSK